MLVTPWRLALSFRWRSARTKRERHERAANHGENAAHNGYRRTEQIEGPKLQSHQRQDEGPDTENQEHYSPTTQPAAASARCLLFFLCTFCRARLACLGHDRSGLLASNALFRTQKI